MLDWLKDKIKQGTDAGARLVIAKALREHFEPLEKLKGIRPGAGERLARFVVSGSDQQALNEITARPSGAQPGIGQIIYYGGQRGQFSQGLGILLKVLPEACPCLRRKRSPGGMVAHFSHIPGFRGAHHWLAKKRGLAIPDSVFASVGEKIPALLTPGAAETLVMNLYRKFRTGACTLEEALFSVLNEYQNPVAAEVMAFQIQLAANEATALDFVPEAFRRKKN